jgi:outer membrane protein assembly factor BamE
VRRTYHSLSFAGLAALCACAPPQIIQPYRMDIQQGNYISQEMISQLKIGMTKEQVRYVLGTPLVADIFHADRWDYVYYKDPRRGTREGRKIAVVFENGKLARVTGDVVFAEPKFEPAPAPRTAPSAPAPQSVAEPPKPVAEAPKPADEPVKSEPAKDEAPQAQSAQTEQQTERGFFGRILEKLGL